MASRKPITQTETRTEKRLKTLAAQTDKKKTKLLEQLTKYPIVQVACERARIGRATYYKWREDDEEFKKLADKTLQSGVLFINDLAESMLIRNIQNDKITAIIYWLKNHHPEYMEVIRHRHKHMHEIVNNKHDVDPEQIELIKNVMGNFATKARKNKEQGITTNSFTPNAKKPNSH